MLTGASVLSYESIAKVLAGVLKRSWRSPWPSDAPFLPCTFPPTNARASSAGSGVQPLPRRWLCDPGSFSVAPRARPIPSWPGRSVWPSKRWGSGGPGSSNAASTACLTSRGPAAHAPSRTPMWSGSDPHPGDDAGDATHWSTRSMAARTGLSQSAISRIWRAFALQPHRTETFKLSSDPLFIEKVRDIVGLYLNPPQRALVLCVDEKSQIQALDRTAPRAPGADRAPATVVWYDLSLRRPRREDRSSGAAPVHGVPAARCAYPRTSRAPYPLNGVSRPALG